MAKVIVGMSGGVDSAVTAALLKRQGHEVIGVFMRNWDSLVNNDVLGHAEQTVCPEEVDWADVKQIGDDLGIPVHRVDFVKEYWDNVFTDLVAKYEAGLTPNPDVLCNREVKFGVFYEWVFRHFPDADFIATGHYAKLQDGILLKPRDHDKDQTYFLAQVHQDKLKKTLFPLADLLKSEVRQIAHELKLNVATKRDSVGVCFIGKRDFTKFLQNYIPALPGPIVELATGKTVGTHEGAMYYTIGKRSGIGLSGMEEPYYVCGHDLAKRTVYVAPRSNQSYLFSDRAIITGVNWFSKQEDIPALEVKFRYRSESVACTVHFLDATTLEVTYPQGFLAVTPGQQAVFYLGDRCLGGGFISEIYAKGERKRYV